MRLKIWWQLTWRQLRCPATFLSQFSLSAACPRSLKSMNLQAGTGGMKSHPSEEKVRFETLWGTLTLTSPWCLMRCIPGFWGNWLVQERHGPAWTGPKQGHGNCLRVEMPFAWRQAETCGVVHPGEQKGSGRPYWCFSILEEGLQERWRDNFYQGQ